jgi:hypothetical protein
MSANPNMLPAHIRWESHFRKKNNPKTTPTEKVALMLQFWSGDKNQAMNLARLITDMQQRHSDSADFFFVSRFDCPHDRKAIEYVSRKFNVRTVTSRRRGKGWPHGCNELWFSTIESLATGIETDKFPHYRFAFTFEADCVPTSPNWLSHLIRHWDEQQHQRKTYVMGAELQSPATHINGNALFSTDLAFLRWLCRDVCAAPSNQGWDYALAPQFRNWGVAVMPGMQSYWQTATFSVTDIKNCFDRGDVWVHGVKDESLLRAARTRFL